MQSRRSSWSAQVHSVQGTLEVREVLLGQADCVGLVVRFHVDHAVEDLDVPRADLLGCKGPEAAPLDHRRTPHADVGVGSGDDHVAAAQEGRIPGEAAPRDDAHQRHQAAQPPEESEGLGVEARDHRRVGIARSTTTPFGEEDDGQPQPFDQREEPVLLAVVHLALGAGQHRVVVGEHGGAGVRIVEVVAVDAPDPGDQAVGWGVVDEIVEVAPRPLCRHDQRSVLLEALRGRTVRRCSRGPFSALRRDGAP